METEPDKARRAESRREHPRTTPREHCGFETSQGVVKAAFWSSRGLIAIEDIPARACEACGEQFYDEEAVRRVEKIIADPRAKATREIRVPVFSLLDVEVPKRGSRPEVLDEEEIEAIELMLTGMEPAVEEMEKHPQSQDAYPCKYCEADTDEAVVKSAFWTDKGMVALEDVPARVCRQCREQFYDDETTRKIAKLMELGFPAQEARREILVPLISLGEIRS